MLNNISLTVVQRACNDFRPLACDHSTAYWLIIMLN